MIGILSTITVTLCNVFFLLFLVPFLLQYHVEVSGRMFEGAEQPLMDGLWANLTGKWCKENAPAIFQKNIVKKEVVWTSSEPGGEGKAD